jgi:hypothetical protein
MQILGGIRFRLEKKLERLSSFCAISRLQEHQDELIEL